MEIELTPIAKITQLIRPEFFNITFYYNVLVYQINKNTY